VIWDYEDFNLCIYRMNYRYLRSEAENWEHFVAFIPPSSGIILGIY